MNNNKNGKNLLERIGHIEKELGNLKFELFKQRGGGYYFNLPFFRTLPPKKTNLIERTAGMIGGKADIEKIIEGYEEHLFQSGLGK